MKFERILAGLVLMLLLSSCQQQATEPQASKLEQETERKISSLLKEMTLEEKVGQMTQITLDVLLRGESPFSSYEPLEPDTAMMRLAFEKYKIGSVLNTANNRARNTHEWNRLIRLIQDYAIANSRQGIPIIYGLDMIHGASYVDGATMFPQQIGMAATWNPELLITAGEITAYETRATGVAWTFSPVLDLGVDPRWPRQWETFGEDPYLASVMGQNLVFGLQGPENNLADPMRITACAKHYLGYSQTLSGKDRTPAWIPEHKLREYHLPAFKAVIDAGVPTVMVNSGEINGIPVHINKALLTDLLKTELQFKGFILTDWGDIEYLHTRHKVASSHKEAVKLAINAGIDMSMVPYNFNFADHLIALVNEGEVPVSRIDDAVTRILRVKMQMGLFEKPYTVLEDYPLFGSVEFADAARKTALESITLLKNHDNILPLTQNLRILVGGPAANTMRPLNGGWSYSWQGELTDEFTENYNTIFEAIRDHAKNPTLVTLYEGVQFDPKAKYDEEIVGNLATFERLVAQHDVVVLCIGENSYCETPGNLTDLHISANQKQLVELAAKSGKPVILVLVQGRPRIISKIEPLSKAILHTYLPGNYGGEAVAKILFGEVNPSGKLPYTYPRFPNSLEPYYHKHTEALKNDDGSPNTTLFYPQYQFGFGMSYADFEYSDLSTNKKEFMPGEIIELSVVVRNKSAIAGKETVQVFSSDHYATLTPSVKRLRAFSKILISPGESKKVEFQIPVDELSFVNLNNTWVVEKGDFSLQVGEASILISVLESSDLVRK